MNFLRNINRVVHIKGGNYKGFKSERYISNGKGCRWMITITVDKHGFIKEVLAPTLLEYNVKLTRDQIEESKRLELQILNGYLGDVPGFNRKLSHNEREILAIIEENGACGVSVVVGESGLSPSHVSSICNKLYRRGLIKKVYRPKLMYELLK